MEIKTIYIYDGENGVIQTPIKLPITERKQLRRLVADQGKELINGDQHSVCVDVEIDDTKNWVETEINEFNIT